MICVPSGIAKRIASHGYAVHAMDYYGHGLSEGLHGYIPSFDLLIEDVREHYKNIRGIYKTMFELVKHICVY